MSFRPRNGSLRGRNDFESATGQFFGDGGWLKRRSTSSSCSRVW